ncbi:MAG: hypothetical protein L0Y64_07600, partial [Myxococcaceae bacterium]|nr:hypothetical protein [Myxococcaceae bacterium]
TVTDEAGRRVLQVVQALPEGLSASTVRGATSPFDGWYSEYYEVREASTVLFYPREGLEAQYVTLFTSGPHTTAPARVSASVLPEGLEVIACAAGRSHRVLVQRPGEADESVDVTTTAAACEQDVK